MTTGSETVVPFVADGHPSPISDEQTDVLSNFFDVIKKCIEAGAEKLKLTQSKIVGEEFWLKLTDGGFFVINPDEKIQTIVRADDNGTKIPGDFGLELDYLVELTEALQARLNEAQS